MFDSDASTGIPPELDPYRSWLEIDGYQTPSLERLPKSPPQDLSVEDEITTLQAHINAATAKLLAQVARLETEDRWVKWTGVRSSADWIAWRLGLSRGESRRYVDTALKLEELPAIKERFLQGRVLLRADRHHHYRRHP